MNNSFVSGKHLSFSHRLGNVVGKYIRYFIEHTFYENMHKGMDKLNNLIGESEEI